MHFLTFFKGFFFLALAVTFPPAGVAAENRDVVEQSLNEKGLPASAIGKRPFTPGRERPPVRYLSPAELPAREKRAALGKREIPIILKERSGTDQETTAFGFPFPRGALFDLNRLTINEAGPLQAHALALWPDGSVKSALLQVKTDLKAGTQKSLTVIYGNEVPPQESGSRISVRKDPEAWIIHTGAIEATLPVKHFSPLGQIRSTGKKGRLLAVDEGVILEDEAGDFFTSNSIPAGKVEIERLGPVDAVIRAEGHLSGKPGVPLQLRYVSRTRFFADSAKVEVSITFINDCLQNEFNDIRALSHSVGIPTEEVWRASVNAGNDMHTSSKPLFARQWSENELELSSGDRLQQRSSGGVALSCGKGTIRFAYHDFWQRWPKGVQVEPGKLTLEYLPRQPKDFGSDLPPHLRFPFVEECYRAKWGMAFTERFVLDFSDQPSNTNPDGLLTSPLVEIPLSYVAETRVFGMFPLKPSPFAVRWNDYMDQSLAEFLRHGVSERQYGYLNWGDWFGERGRNWGNNEYDIPHGFFRQYLFTHDERFLDAALQGVRHQVDVDIIHAYPDPYFVGANTQHAIGHTGITYDKIPARWSFAYGDKAHAGNGHTWADGMADAWLLTGDPVVMESLLMLGEHIRFAFAPSSPAMGTHHRDIGWAALAAAATYRATGDAEYLNGLAKIVEIPLSQWDRDSGIWPYELAPGHARGTVGIRGSSIYNLGILLHGLARYHEISADPRVPEILTRASDWLVAAFREERGWPYSATVDGTPVGTRLTLNLNPLIIPPLAYTGARLNHLRAARVAEAALGTTLETEKDPLPKEFSIKAYATLEALALLEEVISTPQAP